MKPSKNIFHAFGILLCLAYFSGANSAEVNDRRRITDFTKSPSPRSKRAEETNEVKTKPKLSLKMKFAPFELPKNYDKLVIPSMLNAGLLSKKYDSAEYEASVKVGMGSMVYVTMRVLEVADVDDNQDEITFTTDLMVEWNDYAISLNTMKKYNFSDDFLEDEFSPPEFNRITRTLDSDVLKQIWKPDIFIEKVVQVKHPEVMSPAVTVRLNEISGAVTYISRLRVKMSCEMDFKYYPADTQSCQVVLRSNSYEKDEIWLLWHFVDAVFLEDVGNANYDVRLADVDNGEKKERYIQGETREFYFLAFKIMARRRLSYHMVQTYLPSVFFIIITWLCFLVPSHMVEARIGISMTTLLTLTAMFASVRESTPSVSYVRAIDVWMVACIFFVFLTLLEFSVLLWLRNKKEETSDANAAATKEQDGGNETEEQEPNEVKVSYIQTLKERRRKQRAEMKNSISELIEKFAFVIFSVIFVVFSTIYWSWLLIGSGYFDWELDCEINNCEK